MSFQRLQFTYTPPATVLTPVSSAASGTASPSALDAAASSRAAALILRLQGLHEAAAYLQDLLKALNPAVGVSLDYNHNPDLGAALMRLYNVDTPPPGISLDMYDNLLDTELSMDLAQQSLQQQNSGHTVSPQQKADVVQANQAFEDAMAATGQVRYHMPLILRELKGDQLIFRQLMEGLSKFPILDGSEYASQSGSSPLRVDPIPGIPPGEQTNTLDTNSSDPTPVVSPASGIKPLPRTSLDISPQTAVDLNARLDRYGTQYGALYNVATELDEAYLQLAAFANKYMNRPLTELMSVLSAMQLMGKLFHGPKLKSIKNVLAMVVYPMLVSEVSSFTFVMDRVVQKVVAPIQNVLRSMGSLVQEASFVGEEVAYLASGGGKPTGGLTGMMRSTISGTNKLPKPARIKQLDALPRDVQLLSGKLTWASHYIQGKATLSSASLMKAMDRRLGISGNRLEILQNLKGLESLSAIFKQLILANQQGTIQNVGATSTVTSGQFGNLVKNLQAAGTPIMAQGSTVIAVPAKIPAATPSVSALLFEAGGKINV